MKNTITNVYFKLITISLSIFILTACSANGLFIRYFYGEIDDKLYNQITAYATFNEEQKDQIKQAVDDYKTWHQVNELPRYAAFLKQLSLQLNGGEITEQTVLNYFEQARDFAKTGFKHSPIYKHPEFFKSLSDQQIKEIEDHFTEQDEEFNEWYHKQEQQGHAAARLERIVKNTKRAVDIDLSDEQKLLIKNGLEQIKSEPLNRHEIYNRWQAEFVQILKQRSHPDFVNTMVKHLDIYQAQVRLDNPEQYANNQKISAKTLAQVLNSLDETQKQAMLKRLGELQQTINKLAAG